MPDKLESCLAKVDALRVDASALCGRVDAYEASRKDASGDPWSVDLKVTKAGFTEFKNFKVEASNEGDAIAKAKAAAEAKKFSVNSVYAAKPAKPQAPKTPSTLSAKPHMAERKITEAFLNQFSAGSKHPIQILRVTRSSITVNYNGQKREFEVIPDNEGRPHFSPK